MDGDNGYEKWAANKRAALADLDRRYGRLPTAEQIAEFEENISITSAAWFEEREEREERERRRRLLFLGSVPRRAGETSMIAESVGAIADVDAWSAKTKIGGGILVLSGPVGTGKTVAAARVSWMLSSDGYAPYHFVRAAEFATMSRYGEEREKFLKHRNVIVDDLGAEYLDKGGSFLTDLDELFDRFYADRLHLVVTTNLPRAAFAKRYGTRITDRITECGTWITVTGESRRKAAS